MLAGYRNNGTPIVINLCPLCDETLDETGACVCGYYTPDDPLEFDDDDLAAMHNDREED